MSKDFTRVAIVNRGEPAMRFIVAARDYRNERGVPLTTIALYTDPDRRSMFVREADEAYSIGTPTFIDPTDGRRKVRYLDYDALERVLRKSGAEAVWVGWGFVAEQAAFVDLCDRMGVTFLGPSAEVMRQLGDKITSKTIAERAGVPVAPWSKGPVNTIDEARACAGELGYPLMLKATAGGGGRGIRKIGAPGEIEAAFRSARAEALAAFGDDTVFLERCVTAARHVEVQLIADTHGTAWALGVRDCSVQRRNQKLLEETPPPGVSDDVQTSLCEAAVRLAKAAGYHSAGTVEFLYEPNEQRASFMEVNARLQVEHPVTEATYGLDLVKLQLDVARGLALPEAPPQPRGHAIEVRINAEDAERGFAPSPGTIAKLRRPAGPGVRIDTGIEEGDAVPPEFDSMIAKLIVHGSDRAEALARLQRALRTAAVVVRGGASNKGFLLDLVGHSAIRTAEVNVGWLDAHGPNIGIRENADIALLQAAIHASDIEDVLDHGQFFTAAAHGRPEIDTEIGRTIELNYAGDAYELGVYRLGPDRYRVHHEQRDIDVRVTDIGHDTRRLRVGERTHRVQSFVDGITYLVEVDGVPYRVSRDDGGAVRAPSPGIVVSVAVSPGDNVEIGDRLVVLEAMKTEIAITAAFAGEVREVSVGANVQVAAGATLVVVDPTPDEGRSATSGDRVAFRATETVDDEGGAEDRCRRNLRELKSLMLGYDVGADHLQRLVRERGILCAGVPADNVAMRSIEHDILRIFVDVASLFRRVPDDDEPREAARLSPDQYLFDYLRDIDGRGADLPESFLARLKSSLTHYGISDLDPTPELREALFRLFVSNTRAADQLAPIMSILERRLEEIDTLRPLADDQFRALIGTLVKRTQGRFPLVSDLARELQYRYFDRPVLEEATHRFYNDADAHLRELSALERGPERERHVEALISIPLPLMRFLAARFGSAPPGLQQTILEVMLRRFYRVRDHDAVELHACPDCDGVVGATTTYEDAGNTRAVVATYASYERAADALRAIEPLVARARSAHRVTIELFLWSDDDLGPLEHTATLVERLTSGAHFGDNVDVVAVMAAGRGEGYGRQGVHGATFRRGADGGFSEDRLYRGLHPLMAHRHDLWRLSEFEVERLPSAEDVYLFRAVGRKNKEDERLIAMAEVRDLTPMRADDGRIVGLPTLTRVLYDACAAIRRVQSQRSLRERLQWNRVYLRLWPVLDLSPEEISRIAKTLARITAGIGLEKVLLRARMPTEDGLRETELDMSNPDESGITVQMRPPHDIPLQPLSPYTQKVVRLRKRGQIYPYELVKLLAPAEDVGGDIPPGSFVELEIDGEDELVPADREPGQNVANIVVGEISNRTPKHPEGMRRVILIGDPSRAMGALAEPECRRINAALAYAATHELPVEWFAVSAGAKISMDSGTENMDWIALVLRRIIEFTQAGGEINIVVTGINVGAQPYWNAEATMLMHTRGILIMTPASAMVLTGKTALDYSGGVSADDNFGIGGYERIMGPNGQAQYFAHDLREACHTLLRYYDHTYVQPGERFPRRAETTDPIDRDVCSSPHGDQFETVGHVFSPAHNPGRKKPFDIRQVMRAASDADHYPLERWFAQRGAESAVVWDAHIGGYPVCLLGIESQPVIRLGFLAADGPRQFTPGTLFPLSSKKISRAINAASGNRPIVVLANLSGFDGSPESMRDLQLEFGAQIGRAVVNFDGPIVFCVVSRFHGGAFVVFSNKLNDSMESAALEGTHASVIGGAPAAAVVFAREVRNRTSRDPRVVALDEQIATASGADRTRMIAQRATLAADVHSENLGAVAREFDGIHSVQRAQQVGSVHHIIAPARLRPYLVEAIERGIARVTG